MTAIPEHLKYMFEQVDIEVIENNGHPVRVVECEIRCRRHLGFGSHITIHDIAITKPDRLGTTGLAWDIVNQRVLNIVELHPGSSIAATEINTFQTMYLREVVVTDDRIPLPIRRKVEHGDLIDGDRVMIEITPNGKPVAPIENVWLRGRDGRKGVIKILP